MATTTITAPAPTTSTEQIRICDFCDDPVPAKDALHDPAELEWLPAMHARAWCDADCFANAHEDLHETA